MQQEEAVLKYSLVEFWLLRGEARRYFSRPSAITDARTGPRLELELVVRDVLDKIYH